MKKFQPLCYNIYQGCYWHLKGLCHFGHQDITQETYRQYLHQELMKITNIYQKKIQMLQSALIQLQMDEQITSNGQTIKEPNQSMKKIKKRKKKTPVRKKTKKKTQGVHPAASEYETASESGEEEELMKEVYAEKTDAGVDENAKEASDYMKNIGVMRRFVLGKRSNADFEHEKQRESQNPQPSASMSRGKKYEVIQGTSSSGGVQDGGLRRCSTRSTKNDASSKIM